MLHTRSMKENHLFRRLYAKGKSAVSPCLAVYVGKAVRRNKVRRRIREAYRVHEGRMAPGWDIVVVARVKAAFAPYSELERELLRLLDRLGVYRKGETT